MYIISGRAEEADLFWALSNRVLVEWMELDPGQNPRSISKTVIVQIAD
jgi:hypothetical protein